VPRDLSYWDLMTIDNGYDVGLDYKFEFDEKIGTDRIVSKGKLYNAPIFFTSMLSGQRALDNGSFKRLKGHIKFVMQII